MNIESDGDVGEVNRPAVRASIGLGFSSVVPQSPPPVLCSLPRNSLAASRSFFSPRGDASFRFASPLPPLCWRRRLTSRASWPEALQHAARLARNERRFGFFVHVNDDHLTKANHSSKSEDVNEHVDANCCRMEERRRFTVANQHCACSLAAILDDSKASYEGQNT